MRVLQNFDDQKTDYDELSCGEIAFPGGKISKEDDDLLDTAIRETKEETGITISRKQIIGQLKPVTTLNSGFTILPFICIIDESMS